MTPQAALAALDAKAGRVHTRDDMKRVYEKSLSQPAAIVDDDLTIVRYFHGEQEAEKYAALRAKAIAGPPSTPVPQTKDPSTNRSPRPIPRQQLERFGTILIEIMAKDVLPLREQIAGLEARVKDLESRPMVKYAGIWRSDQAYAEGHLTTHKGGLWLAICTTNLEPGTEASGFRLIVKSGGAR